MWTSHCTLVICNPTLSNEKEKTKTIEDSIGLSIVANNQSINCFPIQIRGKRKKVSESSSNTEKNRENKKKSKNKKKRKKKRSFNLIQLCFGWHVSGGGSSSLVSCRLCGLILSGGIRSLLYLITEFGDDLYHHHHHRYHHYQ